MRALPVTNHDFDNTEAGDIGAWRANMSAFVEEQTQMIKTIEEKLIAQQRVIARLRACLHDIARHTQPPDNEAWNQLRQSALAAISRSTLPACTEVVVHDTAGRG